MKLWNIYIIKKQKYYKNIYKKQKKQTDCKINILKKYSH